MEKLRSPINPATIDMDSAILVGAVAEIDSRKALAASSEGSREQSRQGRGRGGGEGAEVEGNMLGPHLRSQHLKPKSPLMTAYYFIWYTLYNVKKTS